MPKANQYMIGLIATILLAIYVTLDLVYDSELWDVSLRLTQNMQKNQFNGEQFFFEFFTYIVFLPPGIAFIAFLVMDCKLNVILYSVVVVVSVTANEILKNIYHQPRPYMTTNEIKAYKCNSDFGKPSGHSQNSIILVLLMPYLIFPQLFILGRSSLDSQGNQKTIKTGYTIDTIERLQDEPIMEKQGVFKIIMKLLIIFLLISSIGITGFSRIYLGVHSLAQVILGWVYGLYIVIIYITLIHKSLRRFLFSLIKERHKNSSKYNYFIPLIWILLLVIIFIFVALLELNKRVFNNETQINYWIINIEKCKNLSMGTLTSSSPSILYNTVFDTSFICAIITAFATGGYYIKGGYQEGLFYQELKKQDGKNIIKRIMVLLLLFLLIIPLLFVQTNNTYIQGFLQIFPISLIVGLILTYLYPLICHKLDIQVRGDIFYLKSSGETIIQEPLNDQSICMEAHEVY